MRRNRMMAALMQAMENSEPPSVLAYVAEYETDNHGLDVIRAALNYEVRKKSNTLVGQKSFCCLFTARPEAQRCQVTPYVVNVAAAEGAIAKYKFVSLLKPS